jgi:hypothetical protein
VIAYYALGGGLGHLVRGRAVIDALGVRNEAAFLTASSFADDARVTGGVPVLRVPAELEDDPDALRDWIEDLALDELILDAFPAGILGELCGFDAAPVRHVARLLRWERYAARLPGRPLPRFTETLVLEPLHEPHARALAQAGGRLRVFDLLPVEMLAPARAALDGPHWLVVHAGPSSEVAELVAYATERMGAEGTPARLAVIAPARPDELPPGAVWRDAHPAAPFLGAAERIVSAAGFNIMREAAPYAGKHHVVPFDRPLDDQYTRAARARGKAAAAAHGG